MDEVFGNHENNDTCEQSELFIPSAWIIFTQFGLAAESAIVNTIVIVIFLRPKKRTPSTILLSALAAADCLTAIPAQMPYFVAYIFHYDDLEVDEYGYFGGWVWPELYSSCIVYYPVSNISVGFHTISVCLTVMLNIQKVVALQFPLWTMLNVGNKSTVSVICLIFVIVVSIIAWVTVIDNGLLFKGEDDACCYSELLDQNYTKGFNTSLNNVLVFAVLGVFLCTAYICWKLWTDEKSITRNQNQIAKRKTRRSALIIVLLSVIFILTELFFILRTINQSRLVPIVPMIEMINDSFILLSWQVGFSLNFVIYLIMSENLRNILKSFFMTLFRCKKETPLRNTSKWTSVSDNASTHI
ncbi:Hypothetical predicted protein [Mytilus galloprovincialis]|uniref:G-protein coupled receptors family 1 profile domain-containing protein n=1 Tax=Mytilus galloprovincialis TaxID=29158 RepID=A0A8B6CU74_MYTGA|nr:Hypothetical predicted protein [Mytilus galloprovincialis]